MENLKHGEKNICPKCGFEANSDAAFCPQCGTALKNKKNELPVQRVGEQENNNVTSTQDAVVVPPEVLASEEKSVPKVEDNPSSDNINDEDSIETPWEKLLKDISLNCQCFSALENNSKAEEAYQEALDYYNGRNGLEIDHFMTIYTLNQAVKLGKKEALLQLDVILRDLLNVQLGIQHMGTILQTLRDIGTTNALPAQRFEKKLELAVQDGNDRAWMQLWGLMMDRWQMIAETYMQKGEKAPIIQNTIEEMQHILDIGIIANVEKAILIFAIGSCAGRVVFREKDNKEPVYIPFPLNLEKVEKLLDKFNYKKSYNYIYAKVIRYIAKGYRKQEKYNENIRVLSRGALYGDPIAACQLIEAYTLEGHQYRNYWAMIAKENLRRRKLLNDDHTIDSETEKKVEDLIQKVLDTNKPSLLVGDYKLNFDESFKKYRKVNELFDSLTQDALRVFISIYSQYKNMSVFHEKCQEQGSLQIGLIADEAAELCIENGIYTINSTKLVNLSHFGSSALEVWKAYFNCIDQRYCDIIQKVAIQKKPSAPQYSIRLGAAEKEIIHKNILDIFNDISFNKYIRIFQHPETDLEIYLDDSDLFGDERTRNTLAYGLVYAIEILKLEVLEVLGVHWSYEDESIKNTQIILENIENGRIPEKGLSDAFTRIFSVNPFCMEAYKAYLEKIGDNNREIEAFANYFGIKGRIDKIKQQLIASNKDLLNIENSVNKLDSTTEDSDLKQNNEQFLNGNISVIQGNKIVHSMFYGSCKMENLKELFNVFEQYKIKVDEYTDFLQYKDSVPLVILQKILDAKRFFLRGKEFFGIPEGTEIIQPFQYVRRQRVNITIPNSVYRIGEYAFAKSNVIQIRFDNDAQVCEIGEGAFYGCESGNSLLTVSLPSSLVKINNFAFEDFNAIFQVPEKIDVLGKKVFSNMASGYVFCAINSEIATYAMLNNIPCNIWEKWGKDVDEGFTLPSYVTDIKRMGTRYSTIKTLVIPRSVKRIHDYAVELPELRNIIFANGIEEIGGGAFSSSNIQELNLPRSLQRIGGYAFSGCYELKTVKLPKDIKVLGKSAFNDCPKLETLFLPESLQQIGEDCFDKNTTLICKKGTFAYEYCVKNHLNFKLDNGDGPAHTTGHMAPAPKVMVNKKSFDKVSGAKAIENNNNASNKPSEKEEEVSTKQGCLTLIIIIVIIGAIIKWIF